MDYRFRTEGALLVLQIMDREKYPAPGSWETQPKWRDAKVEDIPVFWPFTPPPAEKYSCDVGPLQRVELG